MSINAPIAKSVTTIRALGHTIGSTVPVLYSINSIESKNPKSDFETEPKDLFIIGKSSNKERNNSTLTINLIFNPFTDTVLILH